MGDLAPASSLSVVWKSTQYMNPTQAHPSILFFVAAAMRIGNATATATATCYCYCHKNAFGLSGT